MDTSVSITRGAHARRLRPGARAIVPDELLAACSRPGFFGAGVKKVERIDTHISWVFLTDQHVFKFKKPVRFEFLDFSTLSARRAACEAELRLNSRLAEDVYLGIVPITLDGDGQLSLDGGGTPVEWAVKMHRLPERRNLDFLIRQRQATADDCRRIAQRLAAFYARLPPVALEGIAYRGRIEAHVRANFTELTRGELGLPDDELRRVHAAQLVLLLACPELVEARARDGHVVEGHGDLRPEHICVTEPPAIFDCLEFNLDLRTIDTADELSFLAMECDRLGAAEIGQCLLDEYTLATGDEPSLTLVNFYKSYRACVRCKVATLRAAQLTGNARETACREARAYLDLADGYARQFDLPPPLVIVRGVSGSGKTTLASGLAEAVLGEHLATDRVRRELFGASQGPADGDAGRYRPELREQVYEEMLRQAEEPLSQGLPVVLDGTFLRLPWRMRAAALAKRYGSPTLVVRCVCPAEVARERITRRAAAGHDASEARAELVERQGLEEEPDPAETPAVEVDTTRPLDEQLQTVWTALERAFFA